MNLNQAAARVFAQLSDSIERLTQEQFARPCETLSGNTIGQHLRHIIEMFGCLEEGYESGIVDYEKRPRDLRTETDLAFALQKLEEIYGRLDRQNLDLRLATWYEEDAAGPALVATNYYREVAYNVEHAIHHMALMRIGIGEIGDIPLPPEFGIAPSTLKFRKAQECAR